jgi:nicotinamide-nucleotide amidase
MITTIQHLVLETAQTLTECKLSLTTAESCTGGGLSYWLTSVPGSSAWFERGFVTYSNRAKIEMLHVDPNIIHSYGAVSSETAYAMAEGALTHSQADIAIAITGIAGPEGGNATKPVGTIWIGFSLKRLTTITEHYVFTGDRQAIRLATIAQSLKSLLELVKKL